MSQIEKMRMFVSQRLNAAVEDIIAAFEKTIVKYEEETAQCHEVISRQHALLCALNRPLMDSPYTEMFTKQLLLSKEAVPPDHEDQKPDQDLVPDPAHAEEKQEEEQLQDLDEAEIIQFTYNSKLANKPHENLQLSAKPGLLGPDQDVPLSVSSETEDSDDYDKDSADIRPTSDKPQDKSRPKSRFSCLACSGTFKAQRFLLRHVKAHMHDAERVCGVCGERLAAGDSLALHVQTHQRKSKLQTQARTRNWEKRHQHHSNLSIKMEVQKSQKLNKCNDSGKTRLKREHNCTTQETSQNVDNPERTKKRRRRQI